MKLRVYRSERRHSVFWVQKYHWLRGWEEFDNIEFNNYNACMTHLINIRKHMS